jgi:hypothetical protein
MDNCLDNRPLRIKTEMSPGILNFRAGRTAFGR